MKKTTPPKSTRKNGKADGVVPRGLTPAVNQAVFEDAVMRAAADAAALAATLEAASPINPGGLDEVLIASIAPQTPEEEEILELTGVPFLGPIRARALAEIGIRTLTDLYAASPAQIGGVKGVGLRNAERIKEWLATQPAAIPEMPPNTPSAQPPLQNESPDPGLAGENQDISDGLGDLDRQITRLRLEIGPKRLSKTLARQFERASSTASELAEGPDTLPARSLELSVKTLKKIVKLLDKTPAEKTLSAKKQDALAAQLRELRKTLQKQVGD